MKSAQELAATFATSPEEQKRQAVALRRLAGGVMAAAERKEATGLTDKEVKTLLDAVALLNTLATNHTKAQKLTQQSRDAQEVAERAVRTAMSGNFEKLTSVPDRVAFIAAVSSHLLRGGIVSTVDDLSYHFDDCIKSLSYSLSKKVEPGRQPNELVAEAWTKFEAARTELQNRHTQDIGRLTLSAGRTQPAAKS